MKGKWIIAGALIFAEVALCAGITASLWAGFYGITDGINDFRIQLGDIGGANVSVTADEEQTLETDGPVTLDVNKGNQTAFGSVTITGGSGTEVVVTAHKVGWGADEAAAQKAIDNLKVIVTQTGDTIKVNVQRADPTFTLGNVNYSRVDFTITVPTETTVNAVTDFGDITLSGVEGEVSLDTDNGAISVDSVTSGELTANTGFGEIKFEDVKADNITAESSSGEISFSQVSATGSIKLDTQFGGITFDGGKAGNIDVGTSSGDIKLTGLTSDGSVIADTDFGSVNISKVSASAYQVTSSSGALTVDGASGGITAHTDYGDVTVTHATDAALDLSTNSGAIEFSGTLDGGPHKLQSDFGNISLEVPEDTELSVDLKTEFGRIKSDLPITLIGDQENNHWIGDVNGGGEVLTAETNSGAITIETYNP